MDNHWKFGFKDHRLGLKDRFISMRSYVSYLMTDKKCKPRNSMRFKGWNLLWKGWKDELKNNIFIR